jgi:hypothetical protein
MKIDLPFALPLCCGVAFVLIASGCGSQDSQEVVGTYQPKLIKEGDNWNVEQAIGCRDSDYLLKFTRKTDCSDAVLRRPSGDRVDVVEVENRFIYLERGASYRVTGRVSKIKEESGRTIYSLKVARISKE